MTTSVYIPIPRRQSAPEARRPTINLTCRCCDLLGCEAKGVNGAKGVTGVTNITMSYYPPKRSSSPGTRKLQIPSRSSTGTFGPSSYDPYAGYSRSPVREDYVSPRASTASGVIPISTETYVTYPSSSSSSPRTTDTYSGRPRRSTLTESTQPSALSIRTRPTTVYQEGNVERPRSPLSRGYDRDRDGYVKPAQAAKREHKKLYSVDDGKSAKLIAETETDPHDSRYLDTDRERGRERRGYHLTGTSNRPRDIDDVGGYSYYSDPAAMFKETEPRWRPRRGSVDRGSSRPTSVIDPYADGPFGPPPRAATAREGPPPSTRGLDKVNDMIRTGSVREPPRSNSKERRNTYDPYRNGTTSDIPRRSSSATREPVIVNVQNQRPDDRYYRDEFDDRRESRPKDRFRDDQVESRGFGIRSASMDPPRDKDTPRYLSYDDRAPDRSRAPSSVAIYGSGPISSTPTTATPVMPDPKDYMPPPSPVEGRHSSRDEGRHPSRDEGRHQGYDDGRNQSYDDGRRSSKDPVYDRIDRDHDYDRRRDEHHKDPMSSAIPAAAAGAAGVAAGAAIEKSRRDRDPEKRRYETEEEERRHGIRSINPNEREDAREREYSERDRLEETRRKQDHYKDSKDVDPDEEYRRRVEQAQLELARQTSRESQKSDDEGRERRKLRKERPRDKDSDRSASGDEGGPHPREIVRRDRDRDVDSSQQHTRHDSFSSRPLVAEAEALAGAAASTSLAVPRSFPDDKTVALRKDSAEGSSSDENGVKKPRSVRIVEPAKDTSPPPPRIKSILKKPTEVFPEDPNPIKEGALPLPNSRRAKDKSIPPGARWTKISRELVNPQALEDAKERFEERLDCVIVLRVLTRKEIEALAARTREIRGMYAGRAAYCRGLDLHEQCLDKGLTLKCRRTI